MPHTQKRVWRRMIMLATATACIAVPVHAHVQWNRANAVDSNTIALYHFDNATISEAPPAPPLATGLGLTSIQAGINLSPAIDTPGPIFAPQSLDLPFAQTLRSTSTATQLDGDLTIECWFKWTPQVTSATLEFGLKSGARILIARDISQSGNDRFGVAGTHHSFVSAPGFTDWAAVGDEEASLNEWRHLALTIHSAGIHHDPLAGHDVYSTGTVGRLYLNGHPVGFFPHTMDLTGLKVHDSSALTVIMRGAGMTIDEFTVWRRDWSDNGADPDPFSNGRGGQSAVKNWLEYDE